MHKKEEGFLSSKVILVVLWLNFAFLWNQVYKTTTLRDVTDALTYLADLIGAYGLVVGLWIVYNIRIFRKKGPRLRARWMSFTGTHDCLDQEIHQLIDVQHEQEIVIDVVRGKKFFTNKKGLADATAALSQVEA